MHGCQKITPSAYTFRARIFGFLFVLVLVCLVNGTNRYYIEYTTYGTGDTILQLFHNHWGPSTPHRKWLVECLDGEGMIGIQDFQNDYERLEVAWCKFLFPNKPPTNGLYPYYPRCHVRNFTSVFHCYDAQKSEETVNTFVTGLWDNDANFFMWRKGTSGTSSDDGVNLFKCCKTPKGYYIDYVSCYYMPTHDNYWEYYDSQFMIFTYCGTGFVMTGIAKKTSPITTNWNIDWIQCCRVGFGAPQAIPPPIVHGPGGVPAFVTKEPVYHASVPSSYKRQYRSLPDDCSSSKLSPESNNSIVISPGKPSFCSSRYAVLPILDYEQPEKLRFQRRHA